MRKKDDNKVEQLFHSTLTLVRERGLAGITISDIAKAAGMATGTLYIYFKNKEELINALFTDCKSKSIEFHLNNLVETDPFEKRFESIFKSIVEFKTTFFEIAVFIEQCYHSPYVCQSKFKKSLKGPSNIFDLIEEGRKAKLIKDLDDDILLSFMFGCINEIVKRAYYTKKKLTKEHINEMYKLCWDGMKFST